MKKYFMLILLLFITVSFISAQNKSTDSTLIKQILEVDKQQRDIVKNVTFDAEFVEGENKDGEFVEKVRFEKKIYIKYEADTAFLVEDYLAYYKKSVKQSEEKLQAAAKERKEKKKKRKTSDISYSMLKPFYPKNKDLYTIEYLGIAPDTIEGYICHSFKVRAKEDKAYLLNGSYYFDSESFQLVRVDFSPAKLTKKTMFKMKELNLTILYKEYENNLWFPKKIEIAGKGKAMFFIGVKFDGIEYYSNPQINQDIDSIFVH